MSMSDAICSICLHIAQARGGGIPLISPGCCGSWFHQECIDKLKDQNINNCPNCRAIFTNKNDNHVNDTTSIIPLPKRRQSFRAPSSPYFGVNNNNNNNNFNFIFNNNFNFNNNKIIINSNTGLDKEDPLPVDISDNTSTVVMEDMNPIVVSINTAPEYPIISMNETTAFYARVTMRYEESMTISQQKTPMDIICVLDKSGSMQGSKISSLKNAMNFVIDSLTEKDRLSIMSFESNSTLIHGLLLMTPENKVQSKSLFASLSAGGGTEILAGMKHGNSILENRQQRNAASCMFLLTDGQDRQYTAEKLDLAKKMKADGTSLFVFGFGADHDSEHMAAIANAAEGTFTYIESDDMVTDAFGGTIGTIQGASLSNINLIIQTSERNVVIEQIIAGRYITSKSVDGRSGTISFVNMYIGESRDVLLLLSLPAVDEPIQDYELFKAHATYYIQGEITKRESDILSCTLARVPVEEISSLSLERDVLIDVLINRHDCTSSLQHALLLADGNNFDEAKSTIQRVLSSITSSISFIQNNSITISLVIDLQDALRIVSSRQEYNIQGGRASMQERSFNNTAQRECYQKRSRVSNVYQTSNSNVMQIKARSTKL